MKKLFLLVGLCVCVYMLGVAQNRSITFEDGLEWKKVLKKAQKAQKYIFMDCYTSWCGPCKMLAKNVFTDDEIADFYNGHFINVKYDMEKGEGVMLKEQYEVTAFPTLLFIDATSGEVVHRLVGAGDVNHMMAQAKIAVDRENNLRALKKRYESGEKNPELLERYLKALATGGLKNEQNRIAVEYLEALPVEELVKEENWKLVEDNIKDPLSGPLQKVFANQKVFVKTLGAERVERKLNYALLSGTTEFITKDQKPKENFNQERYEKLLGFIQEVDSRMAPECMLKLYAAGYAQKQDYPALMQVIRDGLKYNLLQGRSKTYFVMSNLSKFVNCQDRTVQELVVKFVDELIAGIQDPFERSSYFRMKSILLDAYGDKESAAKAKEKAEENAREGKLKNEGNGVRSVKMMQ